MSKKAFDRIMVGIREMQAIARGEAEPYRIHYPKPAERHEGAPAEIGDRDAPQTKEGEAR